MQARPDQTEEKEEAPLATRMMPTDIMEMKLWQLEGMESWMPKFGFS